MDVSRGGRFSHVISSGQLAKGLRHSKRSPRNEGFLTGCQGAVGKDDVLQVIDAVTRMSADVAEEFPYPQLFVFLNIIIVCGQTTIYEWLDGTLVEKLVVTAGTPWTAVDFSDFIYMSNREVAVIRNAGSKVFSLTEELPTAIVLYNYNGQVLAGSPDCIVSAQGTDIVADSVDITITQHGVWS